MRRQDFEMLSPCAECPFTPGGIKLAPGGLDEIKADIQGGEQFVCHNRVDYSLLCGETGRLPEGVDDPGRRGCAGARDWARQNGCSNMITRYFDAYDRAAGRAG